MKLCFPVTTDSGLDSAVYGHFGSASGFVVVDSDTGALVTITNGGEHHTHGACTPLKALAGIGVDAVIVGEIGGGALSMLKQAGIAVYRTQAPTVSENVTLFRKGAFSEAFSAACECHGHGCSH